MKRLQDKVKGAIALYLLYIFPYVMCGAVMVGLLLAVFCGIGWLNAGIAIALVHFPWLIYADRNNLI